MAYTWPLGELSAGIHNFLVPWQPSQVTQAMDPKSDKGNTPSVAFTPAQNHFQACSAEKGKRFSLCLYMWGSP